MSESDLRSSRRNASIDTYANGSYLLGACTEGPASCPLDGTGGACSASTRAAVTVPSIANVIAFPYRSGGWSGLTGRSSNLPNDSSARAIAASLRLFVAESSFAICAPPATVGTSVMAPLSPRPSFGSSTITQPYERVHAPPRWRVATPNGRARAGECTRKEKAVPRSSRERTTRCGLLRPPGTPIGQSARAGERTLRAKTITACNQRETGNSRKHETRPDTLCNTTPDRRVRFLKRGQHSWSSRGEKCEHANEQGAATGASS